MFLRSGCLGQRRRHARHCNCHRALSAMKNALLRVSIRRCERLAPALRWHWRQEEHLAWNERETRPWNWQGLTWVRRTSINDALLSPCNSTPGRKGLGAPPLYAYAVQGEVERWLGPSAKANRKMCPRTACLSG